MDEEVVAVIMHYKDLPEYFIECMDIEKRNEITSEEVWMIEKIIERAIEFKNEYGIMPNDVYRNGCREN